MIKTGFKKQTLTVEEIEELQHPKFPEPSAKNIELFNKNVVETVGWVDLPVGGFKDLRPRLRVELYREISKVYGPIMLSFNAICPENMRLSKTLAQAHLTPIHALELAALLMAAAQKLMPGARLEDLVKLLEKSFYKFSQ
ncbi:MAG: hypothetical protein QXU87_04115 [Candidatus Caldarchaeum sp.]